MKRTLCILFVALLLGACSTLQPIYNVESASVPTSRDGTSMAVADIADAIHQAAIYKRWETRDISDGLIEASIVVRAQHEATVDISYDSSHYSIRLKKTRGLDQESGKIHRNYNKWVMLLKQEISFRLKQAGESID